MKKILKVLIVLFSLILLKLVFTFTINEIVKYNFNHGRYNSKLVKLLYVVNVNEKYIAYYNDGNIAYKRKKYDKAIIDYEDALDRKPPKETVCDIRINISLATIYNIDSNNKEYINSELEQAKQNLYQDGCANVNDDNGYSEDAEKLEEEIKKLQEQLNDSSDGSDDNQNQDDNDDTNTKEIEEKLKEIEKEARGSRDKDMADTEYIGNYKYYTGKRW